MSRNIFKIVTYIVYGGFVVGFYGFNEQFMEWVASGTGVLITGLLAAPIVINVALSLLILYVLFRLAIWFYRTILWG